VRIISDVTRRKVVGTGVVMLLIALVVASQLLSRGCEATGSGTALVIYSPHWEGIIKEFNWGFTRWMKERHNRDAHIEVLDVGGGTSTILRAIESGYRATPDSIEVDILFGGGDSAHQALARKGYLERIDLPRHVTAGLPRHIGGQPLHDPSGRWYGAAMSSFGIVVNKRILKRAGLPEVSEWRDLTSPRAFGWIAMGDPTSSGSVHMVLEVILQAHGFEEGYRCFAQIAGNVAAFDEGGNAAPRSVALAQSAYGLCIDFYGWQQVAEYGEDDIAFVLPRDLTVITPDPISVLKGAPNPELAALFIEYVLSDEGQRLWYQEVGSPGGPRTYGLNRLPVRRSLYGAGLPTSVTMNPFSWSSTLQFDADLASSRWRILEDLARAAIIDIHADLRDAWKAVIDAGELDHPELVEELTRPPVTGEELLRLAREEWPDDALRSARKRKWTETARRRYAEVECKARAMDGH